MAAGEEAMAVAVAAAAEAGAVGAIPRDYNFAADVLQKNLDAGRAGKPAYIDVRGTHTYGQLADRVARFGAALRGLGVKREERVLIALLDTIDWPTAFLGCLKAGIIAVPVNTLLTEDDYRFMLADSRAKCLVVSEALFPRFEKLIKQSPDHERRHRILALHLGLDRKAERRRACAREPQADRRSVRHAGCGPEGKRRLLLGRETVFRLRTRQRDDVPDDRRRDDGSQRGAPDPGRRCGLAAQTSDHGVFRGADILRGVSCQPECTEKIRGETPPLHLGRRGAAG